MPPALEYRLARVFYTVTDSMMCTTGENLRQDTVIHIVCLQCCCRKDLRVASRHQALAKAYSGNKALACAFA